MELVQAYKEVQKPSMLKDFLNRKSLPLYQQQALKAVRENRPRPMGIIQWARQSGKTDMQMAYLDQISEQLNTPRWLHQEPIIPPGAYIDLSNESYDQSYRAIKQAVNNGSREMARIIEQRIWDSLRDIRVEPLERLEMAVTPVIHSHSDYSSFDGAVRGQGFHCFVDDENIHKSTPPSRIIPPIQALQRERGLPDIDVDFDFDSARMRRLLLDGDGSGVSDDTDE